MKRAEITVGMDVLASRARDWQQYGSGDRYRIVDAGKWDEGYRTTWSRIEPVPFEHGPYKVDRRVRRVETGAAGGVLGIRLDRETGREIDDMLTVLPITRIKATWADGQAAIADAQAQRHALQRATEVDREQAQAEAADLAARLAAAGVSRPVRVSQFGRIEREVTLTFAEVRTLLDQIGVTL